MDIVSECLEFSEGILFPGASQSTGNDCMMQQELPFHPIIFVAVSTGNCHFSLLMFNNTLLSDPTKFPFSLTLLNPVHSTYVSIKILQANSRWYFLTKR